MRKVEILEVAAVTHNVRRYLLKRPDGYKFVAGQATEMALDEHGWRDKKRPFTFAGLAEDNDLEFVIKSYDNHDGVTHRLGRHQAGDSVLLDDPWETIPYHGPGTFIAGGAGITPFLALLRRQQADANMAGHRLIFSNSTEKDIILRDELEEMEGLDCLLTVTNEKVEGLLNQRIDDDFLNEHVPDKTGYFYLCGPDPMTEAIKKALINQGADAEKVEIAS